MRTTITTALAVILILAQFNILFGEEVGKPTDKVRLQQALFAEEAERNLPKAAKEYELLVEEYTEARRIGLSALYRLAEVRRKQKRNDDASKLYLRIVSEFPDEPEARLSRENLTALGVGLPDAPSRIPDDPDETKELRRLMMLARNSSERVWEEVPLALNNGGYQTTSPLSKAARRGWLRVVAFLSEHHKKSGRKQRELDLALYASARAGQVESCRLLVKHGATLEIAKHALVEAIQNNHQAVGDWLLEKGIDINTTGRGSIYNLDNRRREGTDPFTGETRSMLDRAVCSLTPLGVAIAADDPEWIDRLLKLGADVNHPGAEDRPVSISPLSIACLKGHVLLVKRLLELGADPNFRDQALSSAKHIRKPSSSAEGWRPLHYAASNTKIISLLLAAGADAKSADAEGLTPLHVATYLNSRESCDLLLEAGATIDPVAKLSSFEGELWTPLMLAVANASHKDSGAAAKKIIESLINRGANVAPEISENKDIVDLCQILELRLWLVEIIRYPKFARQKGITVALPSAPASLVLVTHPGDDSAPPSLTDALLSWIEPVGIRHSQSYRTDRGTLRRVDGKGKFTKIPFEVLNSDSHPELQWGDIIEFSPASEETPADAISPSSKQGANQRVKSKGRSVTLAPEIYLKLFSKLELKITVDWPDRPRQELTLRGGLRVYDPGRAEAPLVSPRDLLDLLGGSREQTLRITRSKKYGGATIDLPKDREGRRGIRFFDGDLIKVTPMNPDVAKELRKTQIQLLEPESGFRWAQRVSKDRIPSKEMSGIKDSSIKPAIYPTLLQFLTEFYLPLETFELQSMSEVLKKEEDLKQWSSDEITRAVGLSGVAPWATIRHPDLREIWIERLGGERIRFPLAELIAKTNEETPNEFYRKADIELQPGDIVEVRLLPNHSGKPWNGFDPKTTQFIMRALSYDIKLVPTAGQQKSIQIQWSPPHWFETSTGPIAVAKTINKPFIMNVSQVGHALTGRSFKWGLKEKWLRQNVLIQESLGLRSYSGKSRMGGSANGYSWPRHSGLDGRGVLRIFGPRLIRKSPSPIRSSSRTPFPTRTR